MVCYRRNRAAGATYFFTITLHDRNSTALTDQIVCLGSAMRACRSRHPFSLTAIVVLPDHMHCVWELPEGDSDYSIRCGLIKATFTRVTRLGRTKTAKGERGLWQRRFWEHTIRDDLDHQRHVDYIHFNPVRHGYVKNVRDWPYSSFHRYVRQRLLPSDWSATVESIGADFGE
ncbi:MAG: transposase [Pseudomonadota bacterium]|nr:transposase [Pseudomonadota bacterium]